MKNKNWKWVDKTKCPLCGFKFNKWKTLCKKLAKDDAACLKLAKQFCKQTKLNQSVSLHAKICEWQYFKVMGETKWCSPKYIKDMEAKMVEYKQKIKRLEGK
jgi:hypothetical protein